MLVMEIAEMGMLELLSMISFINLKMFYRE